VHALDAALRAVLTEAHPHLADTWLTNFKVRILDETKGSDATIRVLIDATDGDQTWGSIGVSTNLIGASWVALVDSLEYAEQPSRVRGTAVPRS
jgi:2-isopropylmalate synthase